jgi:hypothetical protein
LKPAQAKHMVRFLDAFFALLVLAIALSIVPAFEPHKWVLELTIYSSGSVFVGIGIVLFSRGFVDVSDACKKPLDRHLDLNFWSTVLLLGALVVWNFRQSNWFSYALIVGGVMAAWAYRHVKVFRKLVFVAKAS